MTWGDDAGEDDDEGVGDGGLLLGLDDEDDDGAGQSGLTNSSCMAALSFFISNQDLFYSTCVVKCTQNF